MQRPFFYIPEYDPAYPEIILDEDTSRHIAQVLRMKKGEALQLTDGKGHLFTATVSDDHKKHCAVQISQVKVIPPAGKRISVAISLLKNTSRFEWFLEKATEIGVSEIIPLLCDRTEKQKFRTDRMKNILVSAMLQSQQAWLPVLHTPIDYELLFRQQEVADTEQKLIAHCGEEEKMSLREITEAPAASRIILIGPEGDFTPAEIDQALQNHFVPVSLGDTRLRTETAGMIAAALLRLV